MSLALYDTYEKRKRPFDSIEPGVVRMYNCGPTVWGRAHIGNFRSYLFADVLRRWFEASGYEVRQVMNITDVGHMTDDADDGEDKIEAQARRERLDPWEIGRRFTELFVADREALGILPPHVQPRATDHVPHMLRMIEGLIERGHAYRTDGDVYFDVASFPPYGRLSGNRVEDLVAGKRVEVRAEKRHPADFALWKSDPHHLMKWESDFGPHGYPGWHIECSAMALAHLGDEIDIHTGGEDNVFPHHECEIAQSESYTGKRFARFWMHAKFLQVDGGKMAKSLGNVFTLDDVRERGYEPRVLRYALIRGHYRQPLNFTWAVMDEARSALEGLDDLARRLRLAAAGTGAAPGEREGEDALASARAELEGAMDDDLSVPAALAALFGLRSALLEGGIGRATAEEALSFLERANAVLGVIRLEEDELDARVQERIRRREEARGRRDFAEADRIRDELAAEGVLLEDTPAGTIWRRG